MLISLDAARCNGSDDLQKSQRKDPVGPALHIIYGNNGQGNKLVGGHSPAGFTKSFRTQRLQEAMGEEVALVRGRVTTGEHHESDLQVSL